MGHVQRCAAHLLHIVGFGQPMAERMRGRYPSAQGHTLGIDRQDGNKQNDKREP